MSETEPPGAIDPTAVPSGPGCADCDAADPPGWWVHLRRCATCGHVGCCDSSPGRHASGHADGTGHPVVQSFEPGEDWFWSYPDAEFVSGAPLAPPTSRPADQASPGPRGRVPSDWLDHIHR